jgi:hypothetical protein
MLRSAIAGKFTQPAYTGLRVSKHEAGQIGSFRPSFETRARARSSSDNGEAVTRG